MSDKNNTCTICLDEINDNNVSYLPCCHGFHQECFTNYITDKIKSKKNVSCPICRIEHFVYGQRNYEFIMNELGITYDNESNRSTPYEQYIPSGLHDNNLSRININIQNAHSIITMPMPVSPNSNTVRTPTRRRQQIQQTTCNVFWFKYRYYVIFVVLVLIISSVSFLFISH
jgi:Ring finger domain